MSCPLQIYKQNYNSLGILDRFDCQLLTKFKYLIFSKEEGLGNVGIAKYLDERTALKTPQVALLLLTFLTCSRTLTFLNCMQKLGKPFFTHSLCLVSGIDFYFFFFFSTTFCALGHI